MTSKANAQTKKEEVAHEGHLEVDPKATVPRHSGLVRFVHWTTALSGLALLFSGFGELPMYKRYNIIKIPGLSWSSDYEIQLVIHYVAAIIFSAAVLFHIIYHFRRKEFAAWPKKGDTKESVQIIKAMIMRKEEPPQGKFLAEQRLAYAAIGVVSVVLLVTGFLKVAKNFQGFAFGPTSLTILTLIHTLAAMAFMLLFLSHIGAFVLKPNWPLLGTMFTGRVNLRYALHRHSKWNVVQKATRKLESAKKDEAAPQGQEEDAATALAS